jgi:hypothetical protein
MSDLLAQQTFDPEVRDGGRFAPRLYMVNESGNGAPVIDKDRFPDSFTDPSFVRKRIARTLPEARTVVFVRARGKAIEFCFIDVSDLTRRHVVVEPVNNRSGDLLLSDVFGSVLKKDPYRFLKIVFHILAVMALIACVAIGTAFWAGGGEPFAVLAGGTLVLFPVWMIGSFEWLVALASLVYLSVVLRALFRLVWKQEIDVKRTIKQQQFGNTLTTYYRDDTLRGNEATLYWVAQVGLGLVLYGHYVLCW